MLYLIDGYNLLNVASVPVPIRGRANLEKARLALLNFLAESLDPEEVAQTVVVFDAHDPPPGLPREMRHKRLLVRFAPRDEDADTLIEELIREDTSPRRLTVISSDHRIQRAAKRRRARAVDSDVWYAEVLRARQQRQQAAADGPERPGGPLLEEDVRYWLRQFGEGEKPPLR
ncbi:MAG: NYN domain-containing protein [Thermoguttaceae bacterium]